MVRYEILPATEAHARELARTMRPADVAEVDASTGVSPLEALLASLVVSRDPMTGLADGRVVCMFGVSTPVVLSTHGYIWLLSSVEVDAHSRAFLRMSHAYVQRARLYYDQLENWVDARHVVAIRWLRWLGFTLYPAEPFGVRGLPFHRFDLGV